MTGLIVLSIAVVAAAIFIAYRRRTDGQVSEVTTGATLSTEVELGQRATLVQFSSQMCAPCRPTRELLSNVAAERPGVNHVDLDVAEHIDLVQSLDIRRTPTVLVVDGGGRIRHRITGVPKLDELSEALDDLCAVRA